jgi:glycosyltransferase involved in cell wall biosynthesis
VKILINTATTNEGGGVQVANSFLQECKSIHEHEYIVILGKTLGESIKQETFPSNFTFYRIHYRPANRVYSLKNRVIFFRKIEKKHQPDVVFTTSGPPYWRSKAPHLVGYNLPHYIYPKSPFFNTITLKERIIWFLKGVNIKYFFRRDGDAFVTQTDDVRDRIKKLFKTNKVYTVTNTFNTLYSSDYPVVKKLPEKHRDKEFRLLLLSAFYEHKNFAIIPKVIDELKKREIHNIKFVLTISDEKININFSKDQQQYIYGLGRVPMNECPSLYDECDAMFLPTFLECFSASYPEAMVMKKPILTSDLGFARSVCDGAALYFDPCHAVDIVNKIMKLYEDEVLYNSLIEKGKERLNYFDTASGRARKYIYYCEKLVEGK